MSMKNELSNTLALILAGCVATACESSAGRNDTEVDISDSIEEADSDATETSDVSDSDAQDADEFDSTGDSDFGENEETQADIDADDGDDSEGEDTLDGTFDVESPEISEDAEDTQVSELDTEPDASEEVCEPPDCSIPTPFDDIVWMRGDALRAELLARIDDHRTLGYNLARDEMFSSIDVRDGLIECIYTGEVVAPDGTRTPGGLFNTEHAWPRSRGAEEDPGLSDLHHLYPVLERANGARSNFRYGETACDGSETCDWTQGGSERDESVVDGSIVFEVRQQYRGDVARSSFYFSVRYALPMDNREETELREWSETDPPDAIERARNEAIFLLQNNRNPFVDRPDLIARISDF